MIYINWLNAAAIVVITLATAIDSYNEKKKYKWLVYVSCAIIAIATPFKCKDDKDTEHRIGQDSVKINSLASSMDKLNDTINVHDSLDKIFKNTLLQKFQIKDSLNTPIYIGEIKVLSNTQFNNKGKNSQYNFQAPLTNNGAIGDNAKVINREIIKHPSLTQIKEIEDSAGSKNIILFIRYSTDNSVIKNRNFAIEIYKILESKGYTNLRFQGEDNVVAGNLPGLHIIKSVTGRMAVFINMY